MSKKTLWLVGVVSGFALVALVAVPQAKAVVATVTLGAPTASSLAEGATGVTYTVTMTVNTAIPANSDLTFGFRGAGPSEQGFNLSAASVAIAGVAGLSQNANNSDFMSPDRVNFRPAVNIGTGAKTVTISNVTNPTFSGMYQLAVEIRVPGTEGPGEQVNAASATPLGNIAIWGQVKLPNGSPAQGQYGVGVNLRTENFSQNFSAGVGDTGYYSFSPINEQGTITIGATYFIEVWPGQLEGVVSPDPVPVVYNGVKVQKNITLVAAKKTIEVTVQYGSGDPVTTAQVFANKRGGGGGVGKMVDDSGEATLTVAGGGWDLNLGCGWDQELNQPMDCDWSYNQPPTAVSFANDSTLETEELTFTVMQTNASIRGKAVLPDGVTPLAGGFVDIRSGSQGGFGTGINGQNGTFRANVMAGDYKISIHPDTMNPELARYYSDEMAVRVDADENKNLGTIVMKEKTSVLKGRVVDEDGNGVTGVWLNAWMRDNPGWSNAASGANGNFTLYVQAGQWEVGLDQGRRDTEAHYIAADSKPLSAEVAEDETVSGLVLHVKKADASVSVNVVDEDGHGISDMFGYAWCRKQGAQPGSGNEFGAPVDRGTATIYLIGGQSYTCGMHIPPEGERSLEEEVEVDVAAGGSEAIQLTLVDNDSVIKGWLKDQNGRIVQNANAEVFAQQAGNWSGWRPGKLNADGSYRISVLGGQDYMVGVHFFNRENSEYLESPPQPDSAIRVPANTEVTKIITIFKADTYVSGTVYDPDGNPMSYVWVGADNFKGDKLAGDFEGGKQIHAGTETSATGRYRLALVSDTYHLFSGMPPERQGELMPPEGVEITVTAADPATGVNLYYREADAFVNATAELENGEEVMFGFCHAWQPNGGGSGQQIFEGSARIPLTAGEWWVGCDYHNPETNKFYRSEEQQVVVAKDDEVDKVFTLIEASFTIPEPITQTFTATQQNVFTMPDGTTVNLPANAAGSDESTYTFRATPTTNVMYTDIDKPFQGFAYDFEITKQDESGNVSLVETFNSAATICMPIPIDYLNEVGLTVNDIFSKYWDSTSGAWKIPDSAVINEADGTACVSTTHFTQFALTTGATFGAAAAGGPAYLVATPMSAGGPQVTIWDANGHAKLNFFAYSSSLRIGIQALTGDVDGDGTNEIIVAPGQGAGPQIRIFDLNGNVINQFFAFASHIRSGVKIAVADVDGDGVDEIIVTTMSGAGPQIRIFNGSGEVESQFFAYAESFRGGVNMTTGDVDGDGVAEIVVATASAGGPQVRVFDYDGTVVSQFMAYASTVRGGYHVATGDVDNDGTADIIVTPGPGLGPQIAMFTGSGDLIGRFFAYATNFRGGLNVSVGDINGDGINEIVATPESNAGPHIRIFNVSGNVISQYWAYAQNLRGNFMTVVADLDQDGVADVITAPGSGMGPHVRAFNYSGSPVAQFFTHHTGFRGGISISTVPVF